MSLDTTRLGQITAELMDRLADEHADCPARKRMAA